jgi:hypothetical protein
VAAAVQAEVLPGDPNPLEVLGRREHLLDELAILVLESPPLDESTPGLSHTIGEPVPDHLQLTEVEHPRGGGSCLDVVGNLRMTKTLANETGELPLEPGNLPAQLQPRVALVNCNAQPVEFPLFQQTRHL